jgi:DNA-binding transcriptional ArsR family regulator
MSADPNLASLAALITEPARAAMLSHLLDGRGWTAAELGKAAGVRPPTASAHLRKLLDGKLIRVSALGRHRYFRLAGPEVARMLEQLANFAPPRIIRTPGEKRASLSLRRCRLCYDHLAGELGVAITESMLRKSWLIEAEPWYRLSDEGVRALGQLGIAGAEGRMCMDWSERRPHLAGALGRRMAEVFLEKDWLQREKDSRALWLTPVGRAGVETNFQIDVAKTCST